MNAEDASRRFARGRRRAEVPEWFAAAQVVGIAAVAVIVVVSFLLPGRSARPVPDSPFAPAQRSARQAAPAARPAARPAVPSATSVELPSATGGVVAVPADVLAVARAGAAALLSGRVDGLAVSASSPPARPTVTWPSPAVGAARVASAVVGDSYVLVVDVDPDGTGPETPRAVQVRVVLEDGRWVLAG